MEWEQKEQIYYTLWVENVARTEFRLQDRQTKTVEETSFVKGFSFARVRKVLFVVP